MKSPTIKYKDKLEARSQAYNASIINNSVEYTNIKNVLKSHDANHITRQQIQRFIQKTAVKRFYITLANTSFYLTQREAECLKLLSLGCTAKEAAELLKISPKTMDVHINKIKEKFNCVSLFQLGELISQFIYLLASQIK